MSPVIVVDLVVAAIAGLVVVALLLGYAAVNWSWVPAQAARPIFLAADILAHIAGHAENHPPGCPFRKRAS